MGEASVAVRVMTEEETVSGAGPAPDFHQSPERLRWLRHNGIATRHVVAERDGRVLATAVLERTADRWFLWKGPAGTEPSAEILAKLLAGCAELTPATWVLQPGWVDRSVLRSAGYVEAGVFTTRLVPTEGSEAELLARMKPATRRQVKRGMRAGLRFVEGAAEIERFYPVYARAMAESGSPDFATLAEQASLVALPRVHLFLALAGEEVAAGSICLDNTDAYEARYVATNAAYRHLGALHFVHFRTIERAARACRRFFDLSGIACGEMDDKLANINRFKEGFGGERYEYPIFTRD